MDTRPEERLESIELGPRVARELDLVGRRRQVRVAGIVVAGRRRRPSGERAPLPKDLQRSGLLWLVAGLTMVVVWISLFAFPSTTQFWERVDLSVLEQFVEQRTPGLDSFAEATQVIGEAWLHRTLRIATVLALVFVRRWRHLFVFLLAVLFVEASVAILREAIGRVRPPVPIIGWWEGPSHPSATVAGLASTLAAMAFVIFPRGRRRLAMLLAAGAVVLLLVLANLYTGVDHPTDALVAAVYAPAVVVVFFRVLAPEAAFPVVWRTGVKAHLDVTGARGEAIRLAVQDQLGLEVLEIEPVGLEGSGGSTPLRLLVSGADIDAPPTYVFAKLYSQTHLRSDRWYKVGRTILYGSLEDEVRFSSVRRLVEYEDYIQRLMRDCGIPSAEPFGIVEITPEREYVMVSEFLDGAVELTDAEVDDDVIDQGMEIVRQMWDAGLAHRDLKAANVMVRDGTVVLIDVAFGTVRPSPWRQAVDLANMMVILGLRADAERVYDRALRRFAPEDVAEAFAATRSVTLPSQSRSSLSLFKRETGIDLVHEFRRLAPATELISIQRWSPRRVGLALVSAWIVVTLITIIISEVRGTGVL